MSDTAASAPGGSSTENGPAEVEAAGGAPRRVIGTPSATQARTMLAADDNAVAEQPELPPPPDDDHAKRAEKVVALCFLVAMLAGIGFLVSYALFQVNTVIGTANSNRALGGCLALAMLMLGVGATIWVRHLMPHVEITEERPPLASTAVEREEFAKTFTDGADSSGFTKRPLVRRTLIAATVPIAVAPLFLLRDMGPLPGTSLDTTVWRKGLRLMTYGSNRPLTPGDFEPGSMITVVPEGYQTDDEAVAKAAVIVIKFAPGELQKPTNMNWTIDDTIVAYSKICTHLGCPAALYEQTTMHILCPCHQSTFDAPRGATVLFGPATRPLPQLPLMVDAQGYLAAQSDFHEPVGPSFWERS